MNNILETIRSTFSNILDQGNNFVEPYVKPVLDYLNQRQYITLALIFLALILLLIPGLFSYLKRAVKFLLFLIILFGVLFLIIKFV